MIKWTRKYIKILKRDYPKKGSNIHLLRKKFSHESIRSKAKALNIKVSKIWKRQHFKNTLDRYRIIRWGKKEISILKREYPKKGINIKQLLKKFTKGAIKRKASLLNIHRIGRNWTQEEIRKLKRNWKINAKLGDLFTHRSLSAVYKKAKRLSLKRARKKAKKALKRIRKKK